MGLEAAYVPLLISAAGAVAGAANKAHAAKKQDESLAAGIKLQGQHQQEAANEVNSLAAKRAQSNPDSARATANAQLMDTLRRNQANGPGSVPDVVGASDRYRAQVEQGNESVGDFGSQLGGQIATVDSAARQREAEGMDSARTASAISEIQRRAAGDNAVNQMRTRAIAPNAGVGLLATLAQNIGGAGAQAGGFGKLVGATGASKYAKLGKMTTGAGSNFVPAYSTDPFSAGTGAFA